MGYIRKIFKAIKERQLYFKISKKFAVRNLNRDIKKTEKKLTSFLNDWNKEGEKDNPISNTIYFFWWDGEDSLPAIPKKCYSNLKHWYGKDYDIVFVDKNNYESVAKVDPGFIKLFQENKISIQMFSDILRFSLLYNNGGYWVDSSMLFLSDEFSFKKLLEKADFNSVTNLSLSTPFIEYKGVASAWCSFLLAGKQGNQVSLFMLDGYKEYLSKNKHAPYLLIDILFELGKVHNKCKDLKNIGETGIFAYYLTDHENEKEGDWQILKNNPQKLINSTDLSKKNQDGILISILGSKEF